MLSPDQRTSLLQHLKPHADLFEPNESVRAFAAPKRITTASGVSGVGKDTVLGRSGLPLVKGRTTRPRRPTEIDGINAYTEYYDFERPSVREMLRRMMKNGEFVQVESHPGTRELYGTIPEDYPADACVMDVTAHAGARMRRQRLFAGLYRVHIVTPTFDDTLERLSKRDGPLAPDHLQRLSEGHGALEQDLADPETFFIINTDVDRAADQLRTVATTGRLPEGVLAQGRAAGAVMLDGLQDYLARTAEAA